MILLKEKGSLISKSDTYEAFFFRRFFLLGHSYSRRAVINTYSVSVCHSRDRKCSMIFQFCDVLNSEVTQTAAAVSPGVYRYGSTELVVLCNLRWSNMWSYGPTEHSCFEVADLFLESKGSTLFSKNILGFCTSS